MGKFFGMVTTLAAGLALTVAVVGFMTFLAVTVETRGLEPIMDVVWTSMKYFVWTVIGALVLWRVVALFTD